MIHWEVMPESFYRLISEIAHSIILDSHIAPDVAILDPRMVESLPPRITAFTGMDALTHAVEAIHSLQSEPISDALALHAIRFIFYLLDLIDIP